MLNTISTSTIIPSQTAAWREALAIGDIVSFRFPVAEDRTDIAPKARPCLVLDLTLIGEIRYATLAYGTSSQCRFNSGYEVRLSAAADYAAAGLHEPTRFIGTRRLMVPLNHRGFVICAKTGAPVLGRVQEKTAARMHAVRARIQAEADIADNHRRTQRKRSGSFGRMAPQFSVARRRSRPKPIRKEGV
ncbi:hypothetical protein [Meridianimarinicoccus aquatilis]|uniref:Uncharacterized protein n=1 Tax=Meridianimarinicoccus aquatilis TaxID=2552766 RepID=A0A4R6AJQ2_9RHOB|nr:hypothetical protein [Fluviibacterium aquatile]TDL83492.1 hypothetical protein E2L05_19460 [Fluviibacterium aquatile]